MLHSISYTIEEIKIHAFNLKIWRDDFFSLCIYIRGYIIYNLTLEKFNIAFLKWNLRIAEVKVTSFWHMIRIRGVYIWKKKSRDNSLFGYLHLLLLNLKLSDCDYLGSCRTLWPKLCPHASGFSWKQIFTFFFFDRGKCFIFIIFYKFYQGNRNYFF